MIQTLIGLMASALGFANGANDNVKGVATLIGSRTMSVRAAMILATVCTFAGSIGAILLAEKLFKNFSGKGVVDPSIIGTSGFALTVSLAAAGTVLIATRVGMPISTTHSIVGSIIGVGLATNSIHWHKVWTVFFQPLLISPPLALALAFGAYLLFRALRRWMGVGHQTCVCVERRFVPVHVTTDGAVMLRSSGLRLANASVDECRER